MQLWSPVILPAVQHHSHRDSLRWVRPWLCVLPVDQRGSGELVRGRRKGLLGHFPLSGAHPVQCVCRAALRAVHDRVNALCPEPVRARL